MPRLSLPFYRTLAAFAAGGLVVAAASQVDFSLISSSRAAPLAAPLAAPQPPSPPSAALPDFSTLVEQVGGAVVNISTVTVSKAGGNGFDPDDPFFDFLRRFGFGPGPGLSPRQPQESRGIGSGFIVSPDGYVLTNAHVVADADEVAVKLTDKREFKAKVIGIDRRSDVALIKIAASGLPTVKIGSPERLRVGEWVAAIGAPFGFENSVTAGIVSAKSRALPDETYVPFIQTDVAINPGNSGGPLFNLRGEVVGINSQIYSRSGGYQGISFAIPIDVAMKVKDQLQKNGKVQRGRLGITMQPVSRELADSFGLEKPQGALVTGVDKGSPAEKAGLRAGDVIVALDGTPIAEANDLPRQVGERAPGTRLTLSLLRDGQRLEKQATLAASPGDREPRAQSDSLSGGRLGLAVRPLSRDEAAALGEGGGVVVVGVNGPAARAGLEQGDVVLAVNNSQVSSPARFKDLVEQAGKRFALLVQRGDNRLYVPLRLD